MEATLLAAAFVSLVSAITAILAEGYRKTKGQKSSPDQHEAKEDKKDSFKMLNIII